MGLDVSVGRESTQPHPISATVASKRGHEGKRGSGRCRLICWPTIQEHPNNDYLERRPASEVLTVGITIQEALEKARASALGVLPVSNERGIVGIVKLATLEKAASDGISETKLTDLIEGKGVPHLHADQSLIVALERMGAAGLDALPVVSRADVHKLEGIVALQDVLTFYGFASRAEARWPSGS
jgi:hypothetical protein